MEIFVSYASEHGDDADRIVLTLRKAGHRVFLDRDASLEGQDYDARIREAVAR